MSVKEIEVRAVADDHGLVSWTHEFDANYFAIYEGEPGAMIWIADFSIKADALDYGHYRAVRLRVKFHNRIGEL